MDLVLGHVFHLVQIGRRHHFFATSRRIDSSPLLHNLHRTGIERPSANVRNSRNASRRLSTKLPCTELWMQKTLAVENDNGPQFFAK